MNLDELRSAQAKERRKDSLQHLRDSFYDDVGAYVADLRAARDRRAEQVENPFADDDVRRLSDEVETAEEVAEALYERRVGKVVKLASFAAADMSVDEEGMTTEERKLFDDLVERITANKSEVLDVLAGESPVPDDGPTADGASAAPEAVEAGDPASSDRTPSDRTPSDPAAETEEPPAGTEPADAGPADALAGAMGGTETDSTADAPPAPTEKDAAPPAPEPTEGTGGDGTETDDDPTPVPPESAPPGAVGVDEDPDGVADGTPAGDADESTADATTDGGAVPVGAAGGEPTADAAPAADSEPTGGAESTADADPAEDTERATVRITRDVGAIFGVDEREYELASEDVVSLPVENADPLVQRDAAERID
ncbi:hypothetical protein C470_11032 [Halorubrum distributum JCM 13561]|uniref:Gins51 C-terminal domain-containing protein n=1 Tax=Halorubrum distributum JCM 13561 TaxID=1227483 RepID=M0NNP7_9EURY|nr:hypothetical protein [Halorubrum litoreum]EMA59406.1 hypothetical protein C470_11032 [Halorubrum litoreum JCM 13561]